MTEPVNNPGELPGMPTVELYYGLHVYIRTIRTRGGEIRYALCRPGDPRSVLEIFADRDFANRVARYVDDNGGSYAAATRKAARKAAGVTT